MKKLLASLLLAAALSAGALAGDFTSTEVTVSNHAAGIQLAGTLTAPATGSPRAAIVMATGSGQQNRDEEIFGHKPFKVIAESLSGAGYAVLRMDDRGTAASGGSFKGSTVDDFTGDIASGLHYLDSVYRAVPTGVLGHSEGGTSAIMLGARDSICDFIITLAAPAWRGDSIIMSQGRTLATAATGRWDAEARQRSLLDMLMSEMSDFEARTMLYLTVVSELGEAAKDKTVQAQVRTQTDAMSSPWYRRMLRYDPARDIASVKVPWLALNGQLDMQVLPGNLNTIRQLNPEATTRLMPGLNHLMQHCATGSPAEYAGIAEDISPEIPEIIIEWLGSIEHERK